MHNMTRMKKRRDFLRVQKQGVKYIMPEFVMQACVKQKNAESTMIGFTASKKVGNAVQRNRAKRRMRALTQNHLPQLAHENLDYVMIARNTLPTAPWHKLVTDLHKAMTILHKRLAQHG